MTTVKTKLIKNEQGFYNYNDIVDYKTAKQFLNQEFGKDWHMKIDLNKLNMMCGDRCVLGQVSRMSFSYVVEKYFLPRDTSSAHSLKPFGGGSRIDWHKKIAKRQAKTAKKQLTNS